MPRALALPKQSESVVVKAVGPVRLTLLALGGLQRPSFCKAQLSEEQNCSGTWSLSLQERGVSHSLQLLEVTNQNKRKTSFSTVVTQVSGTETWSRTGPRCRLKQEAARKDSGDPSPGELRPLKDLTLMSLTAYTHRERQPQPMPLVPLTCCRGPHCSSGAGTCTLHLPGGQHFCHSQAPGLAPGQAQLVALE